MAKWSGMEWNMEYGTKTNREAEDLESKSRGWLTPVAGNVNKMPEVTLTGKAFDPSKPLQTNARTMGWGRGSFEEVALATTYCRIPLPEHAARGGWWSSCRHYLPATWREQVQPPQKIP
eukprot:CAMPEP_0206434186 /NCGR_PEP_ID=MMETSP0324_2-20121206/9001_1 /ASSEMBLY_ACC=CAM_ASM_000836 /TAXON_ID=2866 /ORGANISM="Crypthecodinium cohnii, Strain Seligo" /LENGTH=118 /DNA_ID=CAMNT_0053900639 /DNA_START=353 /DNA_END=707 /DNA_ORIENTATION=-